MAWSPRNRLAAVESHKLWIALAAGLIAGYVVGLAVMETADVMFTTGAERHIVLNPTGNAPVASPAQAVSQVASTGSPPADSGSKKGSTTSAQSTGVGTAVMQARQAQLPPHSIHTIKTSNGEPYQNFQSRIMYGTYKLVQQMPGGEHLTGFTRIMHKTRDDELMDEIPTFRAQPLHPECDTYCDFPVADRANAVQQWIDAVRKEPTLLKGAWVLLVECDYVFMRPPPAPDASSSAPGRQYHFDYICVECVKDIVKRLFNGQDPVGKVPNSGPAPALLRFTELEVVTPDWERLTAAIEADKEAVKALGWVREMYAWDVAVALHPEVKMLTEDALVSPLIVQPPHDDHWGNATMAHYTWGAIYNNTKGEVFRWEKRDYTSPQHALKVPALPMPPQPFKPNTWHLQANEPVTEILHKTLTEMLGQMNKAIALLPDNTAKFEALKAARSKAQAARKMR